MGNIKVLPEPTHSTEIDGVLVSHARQNIWANPLVDKQSVFELVRATGPGGAMGEFSFYRFTVQLPTRIGYYHVFQLGNLPSNILGVIHELDIWTDATNVMNESNLLIQLYTSDGRCIPKCLCHLLRRRDGNILLAVSINDRIPDLTKHELYIRFYTNAYGSSESDTGEAWISQCFGRVIKTQQDISDVYAAYRLFKKRTGEIIVNYNGLTYADYDPNDAKIGDVVEVEQDISMVSVYDFKIHDLQSFSSVLDSMGKYLLHPELNENTINFFDDIDVYLYSADAVGRLKGVLFHRNTIESMRQISHNDYSVPVSRVQRLVEDVNNTLTPEDLTLRFYIRDGGRRKKLIPIHNRCRELYKLPHDEIIRHLVGNARNINEWRADVLESCPYTQIVSWPDTNLPYPLTAEAYGYNGIVKAFGETLVDLTNNQCNVPYIYQSGALYWEVKDGLFSEMKTLSPGTNIIYWSPENRPDSCYFVYGERFDGDVIHTYEEGVIPYPNEDWTIWARDIHGDNTGSWKDVTEDEEFVKVSGGYIRLQKDQRRTQYYYRPASYVIYKRIEMTLYLEDQLIIDLDDVEIPTRHIHFLVNGKKMTRGIDYDIANKKLVYFRWGHVKSAKIVAEVCLHGIPFPADVNPIGDEYDFVKHGTISMNGQYVLKDDYVMTLAIDGIMAKMSNWRFAEDQRHVQLERSCSHSQDGTLYNLNRIYPPCGKMHLGVSERDLMRASLDLDNRLSTYLTEIKPQIEHNHVIVVKSRHRTSSPFLTAVHANLEKLLPWDEDFVSDRDLDRRLGGIKWLLDIDPAAKVIDDNFLVVRPYPWVVDKPIEVSVKHYDILKRCVDKYLKGQISINQHFAILGEVNE